MEDQTPVAPEYKSIEWMLPRLYYTVAGGVKDWFDMLKAFPRAAVAQTAHGRPRQIYDLIRQRGLEAFADVTDKIKVIDDYETFELKVIESEVTIKVNKMDDAGHIHRPNDTERGREAYYEPTFWEHLPLDPNDFRGAVLRCGYRLAPKAVGLADVRVQRECGGSIIWWSTIGEPPSDHQFSLVPTTPISPADSGDMGKHFTLPGDDVNEDQGGA